MLIAFHKPYGVISQFSADGSGHRTLAEFKFPKGVYPLGRLDADSEGLLLLSDEPGLNSRLLDPVHEHPRVYWVQVEGTLSEDALTKLRVGVTIQGHQTRPAEAWLLREIEPIAERDPPIRRRRHIPTTWLGLRLIEGKNRQVRRMTAAVGHPTLRLVRVAIGALELGELARGQWKLLAPVERRKLF